MLLDTANNSFPRSGQISYPEANPADYSKRSGRESRGKKSGSRQVGLVMPSQVDKIGF